VAAIVVAVTARSDGFAFTALALVIAGVGVVFTGIASVIVPLAIAGDTAIDGSGRINLTYGQKALRPAAVRRKRPESL